MNIDQIIEEFLFYCSVERRLAKHTSDAYECDLKSYTEYIGRLPVDEMFTVEQLKGYLANILNERSLSVATARRRLACLRSFCRFSARAGHLKDPFESWSPSIKRPKRLPRALSSSEVTKLISKEGNYTSIERETILCAILLAATGLRVSELCAIKLKDVSEDGSAIHVTGKGSRDRIAYIGNPSLQIAIAARRKCSLETREMGSPLFLNSRNNPLSPQSMRRWLHRLRTRQGLDKLITPHMLRHTAATLLVEGGTDIRFVQRLLGHASIATTEMYTRITDNALKHAICEADALGPILSNT